MKTAPQEVTQLLQKAGRGDASARDQLLRVTYDELRRMARAFFSRERRDHTLQATALVHELHLRWLGADELPSGNRRQFFAFAAKAMRHLLVDHARGRRREKRFGGARRIPLEDDLALQEERSVDLLALDEALERLAAIDRRKGLVVELKYFGGLTGDQAAKVLEVAPATVDREWNVARAWLFRELSKGESEAGPSL